MSHLDEGTIHAWLDGALDDADGRRVAAHAAECARCAAAVAEARGLVAAASGIVGRLDGGEAGGAEGAAANGERRTANGATTRGVRRRWRVPVAWAAGMVLAATGAYVGLVERGELPRVAADSAVSVVSAPEASAPEASRAERTSAVATTSAAESARVRGGSTGPASRRVVVRPSTKAKGKAADAAEVGAAGEPSMRALAQGERREAERAAAPPAPPPMGEAARGRREGQEAVAAESKVEATACYAVTIGAWTVADAALDEAPVLLSRLEVRAGGAAHAVGATRGVTGPLAWREEEGGAVTARTADGALTLRTQGTTRVREGEITRRLDDGRTARAPLRLTHCGHD